MKETFNITKELKTYTTSIPTKTDNIKPYLLYNDSDPVDASFYSVYILSDSTLGILNKNLKAGSYTIYRNTQLTKTWVTNKQALTLALDAVLQYLEDLNTLGNREATILLEEFKDKYNYLLTDHLLSTHINKVQSPVKTAPFITISGAAVMAKPSSFLVDYVLPYPLPPFKHDPYSGVSKINRVTYTPIKSISYDKSILKITLYRFFYNPLEEKAQEAIFEFTEDMPYVNLYLGNIIGPIKTISEDGALEMQFAAMFLEDALKPSYLALRHGLTGTFIPLKVFYFNDRFL